MRSRRRRRIEGASSDLVEAIEAEEGASETPLLDQLETDEFKKGEPASMTRRQFIEGLRAVIALPAEIRVTSSQPEDVDGES
jgi:hypothetical protein